MNHPLKFKSKLFNEQLLETIDQVPADLKSFLQDVINNISKIRFWYFNPQNIYRIEFVKISDNNIYQFEIKNIPDVERKYEFWVHFEIEDGKLKVYNQYQLSWASSTAKAGIKPTHKLIRNSLDVKIVEEIKHSLLIKKEQEEGLLIFISYSTKDAILYKISRIAYELASYDDIGDVLYWQEDMKDNIVKYMNDNLGKCDVVLLFCSRNASESKAVESEWTSAESIGKPIIPVFLDKEDIPTILRSRLGVEFDTSNMAKNIQAIYDLIMKRI